MSEETIKRHLLSQPYLKGFTDGESKKSPLYLFDLANGKYTSTRPKNVSGWQHTDVLETVGTASPAPDQAVSQFRSQVDRVVQAVGKSRQLPEGADLEVLIIFIALQLSANPSWRPASEADKSGIAAGALELTAPDLESATPVTAPEGLNYGAIQPWVVQEALDSDVSVSARPFHDHPVLARMVEALRHRHWFLIDAKGAEGEFITADWPAAVSWQRPDEVPEPFRNRPGLAYKTTDVSLPLRRDLAVIGRFEAPPKKAVKAERQLLAAINRRTQLFAHRYLFAARPAFEVLGPGGIVQDLAASR